MGGTNAHVILEQAPAVREAERRRNVSSQALPLLPLSGASREALVVYARAFRERLVRGPAAAPADLLVTAALGRRHLRHRLVVTSEDPVAGLDAFLAGAAPGLRTTQGWSTRSRSGPSSSSAGRAADIRA